MIPVAATLFQVKIGSLMNAPAPTRPNTTGTTSNDPLPPIVINVAEEIEVTPVSA
jgi:hypothetical protein